jgi:tripartite-type tricarboxylate transporter receptor subunit TctC
MKLMTAALGPVLGAILGAIFTLVPAAADAQEYPAKPIHLLIPFTPGGGTDFISRVVGSKLAETLKWQIVPENRPGAAGNLAIEMAAKAAPDGYTIVVGQPDNMMVGPYLYANVGYDTIKSFVPIVQLSETSNVLVTNAADNAPTGGTQPRLVTVADLIAKGKTSSGLIWATSGNGSTGHLYGELFRSVTAIKLLQVPYKGAAPALADVMGGHVDLAIMSVPSVLGLVRGGKLTPVAVTAGKRSAMLPNTPTLNEAGVKVVDTVNWLGLFAPAGTPPAIVARLNAEVNKVLQMPEVREKISDGGASPVGGSPEEFAAFVRAEYAKWGRIVKDSGVKLE